MAFLATLYATLLVLTTAVFHDIVESELVTLPGHTVENYVLSPLPYTYISKSDLPANFRWDNVNGTSYITKSLNQHLPQWCGSCWAHGALSSLADRIKIDRKAHGHGADEINLSIQYLLNCGSSIAGSCLGGSPTGAYQFIHETGFVPYDTCQPYLACNSDSFHGFCPHALSDTTCSSQNTCRTCTMKIIPSLHPFGQVCREIDHFPNATIAEYGTISLHANDGDAEETMHQIQAEILARGPVSATINGKALHDYRFGVFDDMDASNVTTHAVSLIGWETDDDGNVAYIARNSWGEYWGNMGFFRVRAGRNMLGVERSVSWAVPGKYTIYNFPCYEDGTNCGTTTAQYRGPTTRMEMMLERIF
ncbi:hypothetical protein MPSEU_000515300 [Mayamaea pseudoterrestris]|nr:hypothetical protein MPSEU_000515300 [Mayamaea pseudoterrestris]